jgi:hypothetical protein
MGDTASQPTEEPFAIRDYIGVGITIVSIIGVLLLAAACMWSNKTNEAQLNLDNRIAGHRHLGGHGPGFLLQ